MSDIDPQEAEPSLEGRMTSDGSIVTCRAIVLTGTRFPLKQCKSEKAWEEFDDIGISFPLLIGVPAYQ